MPRTKNGLPAGAPPRLVRDVMLTVPKTHDLDLTLHQAHQAFANPHVHMLLLTSPNGVLQGTLVRSDLTHLDVQETPDALAVGHARLGGRTITPGVHAVTATSTMLDQQTRRLVVIDNHHRVVGLLCLKRTLDGFCSDANIRARAAQAHRRPPALERAPAPPATW